MEHKEYHFCQDIGLILIGFVIFDSAYGPWTGLITEYNFKEGDFNEKRAAIIGLFCLSIIVTIFAQRLWEPYFWSLWRLISSRKKRKISRIRLAWKVGSGTFFRGLNFFIGYIFGLFVCALIPYLFLGNTQLFLIFLGLGFVFVQLAFDHDLEFYRRTGRFPV